MTQILPAATTLTIREHPDDGLQVLLLKRNKKLKFAPDYWVFPGGRVDESDGSFASKHMEHTARKAAARETKEEAGLVIRPDNLTLYCHWTTPKGGTRRFATWFFHCLVEEVSNNVVIDQSEITDHIWIGAQDALDQLSSGNIPMLPPTFISLQRIKKATSYKAVEVEFDRTGIVRAAPVTMMDKHTFYCLYEGDAGYNSSDYKLSGPRHRLIINQITGRYHFEYENCAIPPVHGGIEF